MDQQETQQTPPDDKKNVASEVLERYTMFLCKINKIKSKNYLYIEFILQDIAVTQ